MSVQTVTINSFHGGLNLQDHPAALAPDELREGMNIIIDGQGRARRRSGFANRSPIGDFSGKVLAIERYAYQHGTRGTLAVVAYSDKTLLFYAVAGSGFEELFRSDIVAETADMCAGYTPPKSETGNSRMNVVIVTCEAFTIGLRISLNDEWSAGTHSFIGDFTKDSVDYYWKATLIAKDDGSITTPGGVEYDATRQINGYYTTCATVAGRTYLSGWGARPQHFVWSHGAESKTNPAGLDDSLTWKADSNGNPTDIEQISNKASGHITAVRFFNSQLCFIKDDSIYVMSPDADVTKWVIYKKGDIGSKWLNSVAITPDTLMFSNANGVYRFDGQSVWSASDAKIGAYWTDLLRGSNSNWNVAGIYHNNYYIASITSSSDVHYDTLACNIVAGPGHETWTRYSNMDLRDYCLSEQGTTTYAVLKDAVSGGVPSQPYRIVDIGRIFASPDVLDGASDSKYLVADEAPYSGGSAHVPTFILETARITVGDNQQPHRWKRCIINYEASPVNGATSLLVESVRGLDTSAVPNHSLIDGYNVAIPSNASQKNYRLWTGLEEYALGVRITQQGSPDRVTVSSLQLGLVPMRPGRFTP